MDYLFQNGGKTKAKKSKTGTKSKTESKKVGNFLGSNTNKGGRMKGGEEKNPLEKYKDNLSNISINNSNLSNSKRAAYRYLASINMGMSTNDINEKINNIEHNVLKKTLAQNLGEWESILKASSEYPNHFKKQEIQNSFKEVEKKYVKKLMKYHKLGKNEAVKIIEEKKNSIIGKIPPKTKNDFLKNYKNILQRKKNQKLPIYQIQNDYDDDKKYVKYLVNHLKIDLAKAKQIIKEEKNKFFGYEFFYPPNF